MTRRDCITLLAALLPLDAERGALLAAAWVQAEVEDSTARRPALPLADRLDLVRIQCEAAALGLARPWTPAEGLAGAMEGALEALDGPLGMLTWRAAPAPRLIAWARCCIPLARVIPIAKHKGDGQLLRGLCAQFVRCIDMLPGRFDARLAVLGPVCVELAKVGWWRCWGHWSGEGSIRARSMCIAGKPVGGFVDSGLATTHTCLLAGVNDCGVLPDRLPKHY